ncbi:hypothetical protein BHE74_00010181 [Ensete ventricosum]|nr:hypothetical protein BHE74_00010181 [Ensete ventricosum]
MKAIEIGFVFSCRKIEEKRGVTVSDSGTPEVKVSSASTNGLHSEPLPKSVAQNSSTKSRASWDEDWGPTVKKTANASQPLETNIQPEESLSISQQATANAIPLQSVAAAPTHQMPTTCTPVDIEWPPSNSYSEFGAQLNVNEKQNSMDVSNSAFDDLDPFANWPPKPSNSASSLGSTTVPTQSHGISGSGMSSIGFSSISTSVGQSNLHKGSLISNVNNPRGLPMNSQTFGQVNRASASVIGNSVSALETSHPNSNSHAFKSTDIGSIFAPVHNGQPTPRIAPPPTTAIGRGRGRNQGNARVQLKVRSADEIVVLSAVRLEEMKVEDLCSLILHLRQRHGISTKGFVLASSHVLSSVPNLSISALHSLLGSSDLNIKSLDCGNTRVEACRYTLSIKTTAAPRPHLERFSHVLVPVKTMEEAVPWAPSPPLS